VAGGVGILGNLNIGGLTNHLYDTSFNGNAQILSQTASISTSSGALRVAGGVGILGNLNVGGFSNFAFDSSFNGNIQLTQSNNPLWFVSKNTATINSILATNANDVGIFYGTTNPASAGLVISPRGAGGGIKMATNGNVGINTASPSFSLDVTGTIRVTGQITCLFFTATSDYRMKQNTQPLLITISIDLLKPVEYDLSGGSHDMGFLAHEVQEVLPFLVSGEKDGPNHQSVNYIGLIGLLIKEIQDLKARVSKLEKIETNL
jgi:hypothetical protein